MKRMTLPLAGTAALIALGFGLGGATSAMAEQHTGNSDMAEVQAFLASPMTIADAISAAETSTGGKAMSVEFDTEDMATGQFDVEIAMADGMTKTVAVNPADGTVTAMADEAGNDEADDTGDGDGKTDDDGDSN